MDIRKRQIECFKRLFVLNVRFLPKIDRLTWFIFVPTLAILAAGTVIAAFAPSALFIMIPTDLFTLYFFVSPLFGYAEVRESALFIKFGFFIKREIPYSKIRGVSKERRLISESMLSLKCAIEHLNVRYNSFDVVTLSVRDNDALLALLEKKISEQFIKN